MKINVGSKNQTKVHAVKETVNLYPEILPEPEIVGIDVNVDLYGHPKTLNETIEGAIERSKLSFTNCKFSFGLEGGLMEVPHTKTGFMEIGACAIFDGNKVHIGLSPAYEWPIEVTNKILNGEADASQAYYQLGYTNQEKLGAQPGGIIGHLTDGRLTREDFTKYSIIMALIQLEKPELYK